MSNISNISKKYKYTTVEQSALSKDWACGSSIPSNYKEFVIKKLDTKYIGSYEQVKYAPANMKIIDEVIVNAVDHFIRCLGNSLPVTKIAADFDQQGKVRVYNDGPGIEVVVHPEVSEEFNKQIWVPTMIFGMMCQGSNSERPPDCIIGGTNGMGAKLAVLYSTEAILETVDNDNYFVQRWRDNKNIEEDPIIINLANDKKLTKEKKIQHTVLSFTPDYKKFGIDIKEKYEQYCNILRTRMLLAGAYIGYTLKITNDKQKFDLTFNGEKLPVTGISTIADILFPNCPQVSMIITPTIKANSKNNVFKYPWEICVVITDNNYAQKAISVVNGIVVPEGNHIKYITNLIVSAVSEKITKILNDKNLKFSPAHVTKNMFLFLNTKVPNPQWTGQMKNVLDIDVKELSGYKLDNKFINLLTEKIKDQIIESIFNDIPKPKVKSKDTTDIDGIKYKGASYAGTNKSHLASLVLTEGDSAKAQADIGITNKLNTQEYGTMSTGGVPMNARREYKVIHTQTGVHVKKSTKIEKNAFMTALIAKVGLNEQYKYDPASATYKKEMKSLRYGKALIICVDQDLDGKGNILGLILSMFALLWPKLIEQGYLKWFCTPIMRAYPKKGSKVVSFYNIVEFDNWKTTVDLADYKIEYYKGLATHGRNESNSMFGDMPNHLYSFKLDDRANDLFHIYYGEEPDLRKVELAKPSRVLEKSIIAEQVTTMTINCSDYLEIEANEYQKDNLLRKLDHVIDGQNQAGRKIIDGLLKTMKSGEKDKVEKIAGPISKLENYHHGANSLQDSIKGKAFIAPGGVQIPILIPHSYLGSRLCGGDESGSARYVDVSLNTKLTKLLFPEADYATLEFNFEDGQRGEPKNFIPLLPLAILESTCLPGHGWKLQKWARDITSVINNIKRLIEYADDTYLYNMPPSKYTGSQYEWKGEFKSIRGKLHSFGSYEMVNNTTIKITELPLRYWTNNYIDDLKEKMKNEASNKKAQIIDSIENNSNDLTVNIVIELKPGAIDKLEQMNDLCYADGIEEYFMLHKAMSENINFMGVNNVVYEFTDYAQPMYVWFNSRKQQYAVRIERMRKLIEFEIIMLENQIRYAAEAVSMKQMTDQQQEDNIAHRGYAKINKARINNPEFTPNSELEQVILYGPKANYDYLLNMTDRQKSTQSITKMEKELEDIKAKLVDLNEDANQGRFIGAAMFLRELAAIEKVIAEGQRTFWEFENFGRFKL